MAVLMASLAVVIAANPAVLSPADVFKKSSPSVVLVVSLVGKEDFSQGSGVAVDPRTVVTNWHVVSSGGMVGVKTATGKIGPAVIIAEDESADLALLRLLDGELPAVQLRKASPEVGEAVLAIGAPQGLERSMSRGIVSAIRRFEDGSMLIQTDAAISHGSSGGGLFDDRGRLVGITTLTAKAGQALNFAVPVESVRRLFEVGVTKQAARNSCSLPTELSRAFKLRISQSERRKLDAFLEQEPCFDPDAYLAQQPSVKPKVAQKTDEAADLDAVTARWRRFAEQFSKMRLHEDFVGGFQASRELRDCRCSLVDPDAVMSSIVESGALSAWKDRALTACAECQLGAFSKWATRAQKQCEFALKLSEYELGVLLRSDDGNGFPPRCEEVARRERAIRSTRRDGRKYLRVFTSASCVAEVLPSATVVRNGDVLDVAPDVKELTVRGNCGGVAELYFGREERPRVSEPFSRDKPLKLQFRR